LFLSRFAKPTVVQRFSLNGDPLGAPVEVSQKVCSAFEQPKGYYVATEQGLYRLSVNGDKATEELVVSGNYCSAAFVEADSFFGIELGTDDLVRVRLSEGTRAVLAKNLHRSNIEQGLVHDDQSIFLWAASLKHKGRYRIVSIPKNADGTSPLSVFSKVK